MEVEKRKIELEKKDNEIIYSKAIKAGKRIYYLDVNTKIQVVDSTRGINGEYLVSKLTIPLTYNGTMSITATNVIDNIY